MLNRIVLPSHKTIRGSGYDLATYFTQLREHPSGVDRNVVGRAFDGHGLESFGGVGGRRFILALTCIGMGGTNAGDVAEQTHLGILENVGFCRPDLC